MLSSSIHTVTKVRSSFFVSAAHMVFHCVNVPLFFESLPDGHIGCFQHLAIVNSAAMNIGVHRFFWISVSGFLGHNPSSRIARSKVRSILVLWGNSILFSTVAAPVYIPTISVLGDSLVDSIYVGHIFLSFQLPYVFWLEHLIHLPVRLLLIGTYSLPFFPFLVVFLSLSLFSFLFKQSL